jgi:hypothetical protein
MSKTETQEPKATETDSPAVSSAVDTLLAQTRSQMESELEDLRPQHEAFLRLEQILSNFDAIASGKMTRKGNGTGRAPRGSRSQEFLNIVRAAGEKGITVAEAADQMDGVNPNYLYRLAGQLEEQKDVRKDDNKRYYAITE